MAQAQTHSQVTQLLIAMHNSNYGYCIARCMLSITFIHANTRLWKSRTRNDLSNCSTTMKQYNCKSFISCVWRGYQKKNSIFFVSMKFWWNHWTVLFRCELCFVCFCVISSNTNCQNMSQIIFFIMVKSISHQMFTFLKSPYRIKSIFLTKQSSFMCSIPWNKLIHFVVRFQWV